ncbi:MAG: S8/S53 family peptidase [Myxococcales bacterium]|nr:S8/S53 family peptidase [Myxococcales bacterium]
MSRDRARLALAAHPRPRVHAAAVVAAALLAACSPEARDRLKQAVSGGDGATDKVEVEGLLAPAKTSAAEAVSLGGGGSAGAAWRYVALVDKAPSDPCPPADNNAWQVAPLFRQGPSVALLEADPLPTPLERFCEYRWTQAPSDPGGAPSFAPADQAKIVRIDADRDVVVPQQSTLTVKEAQLAEPTVEGLGGGKRRSPAYLGGASDLREALAEAYRSQAGALPAGGTIAKEPSTAPIVAVVDSAGYGDAEASYGRSAPRLRHGLAMAGFVRDVRCPDQESGCLSRQFHAQAFPYNPDSPMIDPAGGPLGSLGSLARAVGESVIRWRRMPASRGPLIVNMSLGWEASLAQLAVEPAAHMDLLKGDNTTVPATVQAVHASLTWAACNQALLIAAAGNNRGAPCESEGPLAPAAWERLPSPAAPICAALFGKDLVTDPREGADGGAGSLVYAAGGLTYRDRPIPSARPDSLPARALPAFQAVAESVTGRTDSWTGTSVAAATLSGIAARAWSLDRQRTPHEIMAAIDPSGRKLALRVDLQRYDRSVANVRRILAHDAFAATCAATGQAASCANPYAPAPSNIQALVDASFSVSGSSALVGVSVTRPDADLSCAEVTLSCGSFGAPTLRRCAASGPPTTPLALTAAPGVTTEPWTRPQPDTPICPVCPIQAGNLNISLNPDAMPATGGVTLSDPRLRFQLADGSWVIAALDDISVGSTPVILDLSGYRVVVGGQVTTIAQMIVDQGIGAGELEFTVPDASGRPAPMVSALSVHP